MYVGVRSGFVLDNLRMRHVPGRKGVLLRRADGAGATTAADAERWLTAANLQPYTRWEIVIT